MPQPAQQTIQSFLDYLKFQKRYSRHTIISYQNDLTAFIDFLEISFGESDLTVVKPAFIRTWLAQLKELDRSSKTINRKISSLKSFFKFLLKQELITVSPMATIISPKLGKRLPQFVDKKDVETLFAHVEFPNDWNGQTERLLMMLLYQTGMRKSELIGLQDRHLDVVNSQVKVLGKGSKERIIPVGPGLLAELKLYITEKKRQVENAEEFLFVNSKGRKLGPRYVYSVVNKYLSLVTTIEKKGPHILRHSFATHLTNNGADLNAVKELLGHSSLAATQLYTHNSIEKLKDIHKNAHPKA